MPGKPGKTSMVKVRFAELPVAKWHDMPVEDKRKYGIVDGAGVDHAGQPRSRLRLVVFRGQAARELRLVVARRTVLSSPDWTSCSQSRTRNRASTRRRNSAEILTPDLEAVARQLNGRVQAAFASVRLAPRDRMPLPPRPQGLQ